MVTDQPGITREELRAELRAERWRTWAMMGVAVGLIRFNVPDPVTAAAVAGLVVKAALVGRAAG